MLRSWEGNPGMSEVGPNGVADDGRLGLHPADSTGECVVLQPQERPQGQADVVALCPRRACLAALHLRALLDAPVITLDRPAILRILPSRQIRHPQVAGRPVCNVAVWGDYLVYLHQPI